MKRTLYWTKNAAKAFVIDRIIEQADGTETTVLDHGCGSGGDWPAVLRDHANLRLVAWDPHELSARTAREALRGLPAAVSIGSFPEDARADVVVSFSVLEHVLDRVAYLRQARDALLPGGSVYLNYDDGHFRTKFDPDEREELIPAARTLIGNLLVPLRARRRPETFQRRVTADQADRLIANAGFKIEASWYHNLEAMKWLVKRVPENDLQTFTRLWIGVERNLNEYYSVHLDEPLRGDTSALWQIAASRTLRLVPA